MNRPARYALWLFVIFLGLSVGAGLYEARIVVPIWQETPPKTWVNTGTQFWAFITSGPLTLIIIAGVFLAWRSSGPSRPWWLAALSVSIVERIATFGYFIPTMYWLQTQTGGVDGTVTSTLATWVTLNHGRHVLSIAAWLLSLKAFSLLGPASDHRN
ncbi:anthrone oxygenase family protein [Chelatococcus reniformis]|uniref:DUF1772 domain-containing protein n=1 Tax=Chelatococcus reniformis TaxID=1494448 RepID=A0A916TXA4_9HYPH|nr:DUF1772 domain-containing protein [Chelatococcus reniformis]GGC47478.1 hypothetical protein GCM10010994_03360 [Chelatococcus reniformis]